MKMAKMGVFPKNLWLVKNVLAGQTVKKFEWSMTGQPVTNSPPYYTPNIKRTSTFYRDALVPNILPVMLPVTPWYGNFPKFTTLVTISMLLLGAAGTFDQNAVGLPNPIAIRSTHTNQQRTQIRPQSDFTKMHTQYTSQIENLYSKRVRICSLV